MALFCFRFCYLDAEETAPQVGPESSDLVALSKGTARDGLSSKTCAAWLTFVLEPPTQRVRTHPLTGDFCTANSRRSVSPSSSLSSSTHLRCEHQAEAGRHEDLKPSWVFWSRDSRTANSCTASACGIPGSLQILQALSWVSFPALSSTS